MSLIGAKEASDLLGVRLPRLYELTRLRKVPFVRFGERQLRFDPEILKAWIATEAKKNARTSQSDRD